MNLEEIRKDTHNGDYDGASKKLCEFFKSRFELDVLDVKIRKDSISLNSVNGIISLNTPYKDSKKNEYIKLFFKFHQEDDEDTVSEYYNAKILDDAGFPTEIPLFVSKEVGEQVLIYPVKTSERFFDTCENLDSKPMFDLSVQKALNAQKKLDKDAYKIYKKTLHSAEPQNLSNESILQLFYWRLIEKDNPYELAGRVKDFYQGKKFKFTKSVDITFEELCELKWSINGVMYENTLGSAFRRALQNLSPESHLDKNTQTYPAVIAHGDAHNGNVWYNNDKETPRLSLFDPAFAGQHIPALLTEIKPLFHNIFAHPLWLYDPKRAERDFKISMAIKDGVIYVEHDFKFPSLRKEFLNIKKQEIWKPLLKLLKTKKMLPENWEEYMRSALFCCPTLVMNLRADAGSSSNSHTQKTSLLGLCISIMLSSKPEGKQSDILSSFFNDLRKVL